MITSFCVGITQTDKQFDRLIHGAALKHESVHSPIDHHQQTGAYLHGVDLLLIKLDML